MLCDDDEKVNKKSAVLTVSCRLQVILRWHLTLLDLNIGTVAAGCSSNIGQQSVAAADCSHLQLCKHLSESCDVTDVMWHTHTHTHTHMYTCTSPVNCEAAAPAAQWGLPFFWLFTSLSLSHGASLLMLCELLTGCWHAADYPSCAKGMRGAMSK